MSNTFLSDYLPIRKILVDGSELPFVRDVDFDSTTFDITVDEAAGVVSIVGTSGGSGTPSDTTPAAVGAASAGVATAYSRGDHVHAHGSQLGGALHALAVAGESHGFLSSTDKTRLDNATALATNGTLAIRNGSAGCAFAGLTATSLDSVGNLDIDCAGDLTIAAVNAAQTTIGRVANYLELRGSAIAAVTDNLDIHTSAGDLALRCTVAAGFGLEIQNLCTSFALSYEQKTTGAGSELAITGQQGAAGSIGGKVRIASGKGGTSGTNQGGTIQLELAAQASGATDYLHISEGNTNFLGIRKIGTTAYIEALGNGLTIQSPSDFGFNATTNGVFRCTTAFFDQNTLYWRTNGSATKRIDTVANAYVQAYDAAVTSTTEQLGAASTVRSQTWVDGTNAARIDQYHAAVTTTDATVTTCGTVTITNSQVAHVTAEVVGYSGASLVASYERKATYRATAGTATLIGTVTNVHTAEDAAGWDCTLDASGATARVRVTGAAATTIRWESKIRVVWGK